MPENLLVFAGSDGNKSNKSNKSLEPPHQPQRVYTPQPPTHTEQLTAQRVMQSERPLDRNVDSMLSSHNINNDEDYGYAGVTNSRSPLHRRAHAISPAKRTTTSTWTPTETGSVDPRATIANSLSRPNTEGRVLDAQTSAPTSASSGSLYLSTFGQAGSQNTSHKGFPTSPRSNQSRYREKEPPQVITNKYK